MKLEQIKRPTGAKHSPKRVGRGAGSGLGKTSGRGHKGQKARTGVKLRPSFEGGQTPLFRRVPKIGFSNAKFKTKYAIINVEDLNRFKEGTVITPTLLKEEGILKQQLDGVKILGNGTLDKKLTVQANVFSKTAKEKIETVGGKAEVI